MPLIKVLAVGVFATALPSAKASLVSSDNAAHAAYDGGWTEGSNGGSGWGGPWTLQSRNTSGQPIQGTYLVGPSHNSLMDTAGRAWGLTAGFTAGGAGNNAYDTLAAIRPFNSQLESGQTFSLDFGPGALPTLNTDSGWELDNIAGDLGTSQFNFLAYNFGRNSDYFINSGNEFYQDTGVPVSSQGVHCDFTLTTADTYTISVTPLTNGASPTVLTGTLQLPGLAIDHLVLRDDGGGTSADDVAYFNNLAVTSVPDPAATAITLPLLVLLKRRRS